MNQKGLLGFVVAALALAAAPDALAQEVAEPWIGRPVAAPRRALEVDFGVGYQSADGRKYDSLTTGGYSMELGAGHRFSPRWMLGGTLQYAQYGSNIADAVRTVAPSVAVTYHFLPYARTDPWLQLGVGYRTVWESYKGAGDDLTSHGLQVMKLAVGVDVRVSPDAAIAPFAGVDVNAFLWEVPEIGSTRALPDPRVNTLLTVGVKGRFDFGGIRERAPVFTARK